MIEVYRPIFGEAIFVDNVPTGASPYAPVYRRIGTLSIGRQVFYSPRRVYGDVNVRYYSLRAEGKEVRRVVFLSRGEPTLDANLGREAQVLKAAGFSLEILTSGAMLWREDVREDLKRFERVVMTVDAVSERAWREVLRPHTLLEYGKVMEGVRAFAREYGGELSGVLHAVPGIDYSKEGERLAGFMEEIGIRKVFVLPLGGDVEGVVGRLKRSGLEVEVLSERQR